MIITKAKLERAKDLSIDFIRQGWTRGAWARDEHGNVVSITSGSGVCWCLEGALGQAVYNMGLGNNGYVILYKSWRDANGGKVAATFNDSPNTTKEDIIESLEAIQINIDDS